MCDKAVENYSHALEFAPECYKTQKICDKAVYTHPSTIKFVPECYETHEMCDKAINRCFFVFDSIPDRYKSQEICDRVVSEDPFLIVYCPDQYKSQRMCDEAVDDCLTALKSIPDWFVTSKIIKKLFNALYAEDNILYFNEDYGNAVLSCNEMGIFNIDLNNINLDDTNYNEVDPKTVIHIRLLAWHIQIEKRRTLKKKLNEELMPKA